MLRRDGGNAFVVNNLPRQSAVILSVTQEGAKPRVVDQMSGHLLALSATATAPPPERLIR